MAERLDTFEFPGRGRVSKYPQEWLDGSVWRLTRGVDFDASPENVRNALAGKTSRRGIKLRSTVNGDTLVVQAYDPEPTA